MMTRNFALALALPLALAASACGIGQTPEQRALARADSLLDDVDATPDQRVRVRAVVTDLSKTFAENKKARAGSKEALLAQLQAKAANVEVINAEADKATTAFASNAHAVVDAGVAIHQTLTPEQRAILAEKAKPGRFMKAGFFVAGRMGYGPPANAEDAKERAAARLEKSLASIEATDAQKKALRPIAESLVAEAIPLLDDKDVIVAAVTTAWKSERPDAASLHALFDTETAKLNDVARTAANSFAQAHAILTPEQRATLATKMANGGCDGHGDSDSDSETSAE
jgi:Spy/CpxP family protein refolding chaperone